MKTKPFRIEITDTTGQFMPTTNEIQQVLFDKFTHCYINVMEV